MTADTPSVCAVAWTCSVHTCAEGAAFTRHAAGTPLQLCISSDHHHHHHHHYDITPSLPACLRPAQGAGLQAPRARSPAYNSPPPRATMRRRSWLCIAARWATRWWSWRAWRSSLERLYFYGCPEVVNGLGLAGLIALCMRLPALQEVCAAGGGGGAVPDGLRGHRGCAARRPGWHGKGQRVCLLFCWLIAGYGNGGG